MGNAPARDGDSAAAGRASSGGSQRYVSSAEAGPDAYVNVLEVKGRKVAVDLPEGTPITPDLLDPTSE